MKDEREHPDRICKDLGKHAAALREIQQLLDGKEWRMKDLNQVAHTLEKAGYAVHTMGGERPYITERNAGQQRDKYRDGNNSTLKG